MTPTTPGTDAKDEARDEIETDRKLILQTISDFAHMPEDAITRRKALDAMDRLAAAARQAAALKAENQELRAALEKSHEALSLCNGRRQAGEVPHDWISRSGVKSPFCRQVEGAINAGSDALKPRPDPAPPEQRRGG